MIGLQSVTAVTISGAFVFGMILVLLETVRPLLAKRLNISESRVDWLLPAFHASLIPMMLVSGLLTDRLGVKSVFLFGSLLAAVGVYGLAVSGTGLRTLGAILCAGAGGACLSAGSTVLMKDAFFPDHEAASQNLGNVFFALGALLTPALVEHMIERLDDRRMLTGLAAVCLLPAVIAALTDRDAFPAQTMVANWQAIFSRPALWLTAMVFFLYGPLELSLGSWGIRYLQDLGLSGRWPAYLLSGFWLAFLAGRLATAFLLKSGALSPSAESWLIVLLALGAGVLLGNLAGTRTRLSAALGFLLLGAAFGPIFPTLVGILFEYLPAQRGTAYGAMFALGATSSLILPPLMGIYARRKTVQHAMRIPMMLSLVLALVALLLALYPFLRD